MNQNLTYAILSTGGKQYRVQAGQKLSVERLAGEVGSTVTLDRVLFVSAAESSGVKIGTPLVEGAQVIAKIVKHERGPKVITYKKKIKQGFTKKQGHRQELTRILIESINS